MTKALEQFRALHASTSGCFVLPNPWDVGTAIFLARAGFRALTTTSAGFAFTRGKPDELTAVSRDDMLAHIRELAGATALPLNADFQAGYAAAHDFSALDANVRACIATGVSGLSLEDATGDEGQPIFARDVAVERVKVARRAVDASGVPVVLTARCEALLLGVDDARDIVLDRLVAFADAGADCLYAPGIHDLETVAAVVKAVAPKPVNVIARPAWTVRQLEDLGVRRVSIGSAFARVAWGAFMRSARDIAATGDLRSLAEAAPFAELNSIFRG